MVSVNNTSTAKFDCNKCIQQFHNEKQLEYHSKTHKPRGKSQLEITLKPTNSGSPLRGFTNFQEAYELLKKTSHLNCELYGKTKQMSVQMFKKRIISAIANQEAFANVFWRQTL